MRNSVAACVAATFIFSLPCHAAASDSASSPTATPVKHLVVIFDENVSFDHYFATYPNALNPPHETPFKARAGTPRVNGLTRTAARAQPKFPERKSKSKLRRESLSPGPAQAATADQNHGYTEEQLAFHSGLMDSFPQYTGLPALATQKLHPESLVGAPPEYVHQTKGLVMGYFDGNTVTALWNYAQRYALNDNSYASTFGQSTQGAIELISGQTNGVTDQINAASFLVDGGNGTYTEVDDGDPIGDKCSSTTWGQLHYTGNNIGQMLSKQQRNLGLVRSRLRFDQNKPQRKHRLPAQHAVKSHPGIDRGLHSASRALPVLHADGKSAPHPALLGADDRQGGRSAQIISTTRTISSPQ